MNKNIIALVLTISFCSGCSKTEQTQPSPQPHVPVVQTGEVFELTMYSIVAEHPEFVFRDYSYSGVFTHFTGTQTNVCEAGKHNFKLVNIGEQQPDLESVRNELEKHGKVPCGQWIEAFRFRFPLSDGIGSVGVADPSWITSVWSGRGCSHPMLTNDNGRNNLWMPSWIWCNHWKSPSLRWLVQIN